jgi:transcription antitermination factor NusG
MDSSWYVLHSKPRKELFVSQYVQERGHEVYYPSIIVRSPHRKAVEQRPYFPGYLFVRADFSTVGESFFRWMPNTVGLVTFGAGPAPVPNSMVLAIREHLERVNAGGRARPVRFQAGEPVTIQSGPFAGQHAIFDTHLSGDERVRVLLQLLNQREIPVTLQAANLAKRKV